MSLVEKIAQDVKVAGIEVSPVAVRIIGIALMDSLTEDEWETLWLSGASEEDEFKDNDRFHLDSSSDYMKQCFRKILQR